MSRREWPTQFLRPVGTRAYLRIYWGGSDFLRAGEPADPCPNSYGKGKPGIHNAQIFLSETTRIEDWKLGGGPSDHADTAWPGTCDHCGKAAPPQTVTRKCCDHPECDRVVPVVTRCIHHRNLYEVQDGAGARKVRDEFEPGDLYYATWYECKPVPGGCIHGWSNCDGKHLICILPSAHLHPWDIDGRASNCTMKDDTTHRCWVRAGRPELGEQVHVSKGPIGHISTTTCHAGAGSIDADGWHGFLHVGKIRLC